MNKGLLTASILILTLLLVLWQPWQLLPMTESSPQPNYPTEAKSPPSTSSTPQPSSPARPESPALGPLPSHPLAAELSGPEGEVSHIPRDLEILQTIFADYRLSSKKGNPSGTNREITSALTGNNPHRLAPIPREHAAISSQGELLDAQGYPYFFHNLSAEHLEIRSTGPDLKHHTADDITLSNMPIDPSSEP